MYFKNEHAKVEIALARGKKKYDKRQTIRRPGGEAGNGSGPETAVMASGSQQSASNVKSRDCPYDGRISHQGRFQIPACLVPEISVTMDFFSKLADNRIREAIEAGRIRRPPGQGPTPPPGG